MAEAIEAGYSQQMIISVLGIPQPAVSLIVQKCREYTQELILMSPKIGNSEINLQAEVT